MQGSYVNMTADSGLLTTAQPHIEALLSSLPRSVDASVAAAEPWTTTLERANEAIVVPTQVRCPQAC